MNVRSFCSKCQQAFVNPKSFIEHECDDAQNNHERDSDNSDNDDDNGDDVSETGHERDNNNVKSQVETQLMLKQELIKKPLQLKGCDTQKLSTDYPIIIFNL